VPILKVKIRYFTTLRELAGRKEEEIKMKNGAHLSDLIEKITRKYGIQARDYLYDKNKKLDPSIYFLVNGKNVKIFSGLDRKLTDGDTIAIIPPIGGGKYFKNDLYKIFLI
jgi:molybdopterin synthase sulfur carrier subunit